MRFYPHEKTALVVDGPNVFHTAKAMGLDIDWGKLRQYLQDHTTLISASYFTFYVEAEDGFSPMRGLLDWLSYNDWQVFPRDSDARADLAVSVLDMAAGVDHFVIATGDGAFLMLVEALQRRGKRVTVLSSLKTGVLSDDLRRAADQFLELESLRQVIARPLKVPA